MKYSISPNASNVARFPVYRPVAYNVKPNVVKLTQNYVQNSYEAQGHMKLQHRGACYTVDIVTHVNTLNKLERFRNNGGP